ncbi:MAG: TetR/AcrR family transcriptional regulator [Thermoanaerobaculia bacterium]
MTRDATQLVDGRRRILDAAAAVFAESGFAGARIDEIAARAGINKAMVYYHVGGKEELYEVMISELFDRIIGSLRAAVAAVATPDEKIRAVVRTIADTVQHNPNLPPVMLREIASGGHSLPANVLRKIKGVFEIVWEILEEGSRSGAFRKTDPVITQMLIGGGMILLVAGTPVRNRIRAMREKDDGVKSGPEDLIGEVSELLLHGISKVSSTRPKKSAPAARTTTTRRPARRK